MKRETRRIILQAGLVSVFTNSAKSILSTFITFTMIAYFPSLSQAATVTWSGGNMTWSQPDSDSWSATYNSGDTAIFTSSGAGTVTISGTVTPGAVNIASGTYTFSGGAIGGSGALTNSGLLTLSGVNTYSGGTVLNAGSLTATLDSNLGSAGSGIIFNGSATLIPGSVTYGRSITINNGAVATFGNANPTFTGNLMGNGSIAMNTGFGSQVIFNGTANTLEGKVTIGSTGTTGQAYRFAFNSFIDSTTANGRIVFNASSVTHANGSVFEYTGFPNLILNNRQIELASATATPSNGHQIRSNGAGTLTINTDLLVSTAVAQKLSLGGSNTGANTFAGKIADGTGAGIISLVKVDTGTWVLSGSNTYSGVTTVSGGTLILSSVDVVANANPLGKSPAAASSLLLADGTTLQYLGGAATCDRLFTLSSTANNGTVTLNASGSGPVNFNNTGSVAYGTAGASKTRTLALTGFNTGTNTLAAVIGDNGVSPVAVTKSGVGTWVLSGANTYTGATTINGGLLRVNGTTAAASAVTVSAGASLGGSGTVNGVVTNVIGSSAALSGAINLIDGAVGTLNINSNLVFNGSAAYPNNLYFELGGPGANDTLALAKTNSAGGASGSVVIHLAQLAGTTPSGTYTLITGSAKGAFSGYALAAGAANHRIYTLSNDTTNLFVTVSSDGNVGDNIANVYWKGGTSVWTNAQWTADAAGVIPTNRPGYSSNVRFAATGANNLLNTLGQDFEINSLTVNSGLAATTISNNVLTINASADNGNTAGSGITVNNAAGTTVFSKVGLGDSQTWTVGSGAALTVNGSISDFGAGRSITKAGNGTLNLSGPNTYTGGFTLNSGTVAAGGNDVFGSGPLTFNGGTFTGIGNYGGTYPNPVFINGSFTKSHNANATLSGPVTLGGSYTINCTVNHLYLSGVISDGGNGYSLTKDGVNYLWITGVNNTYTGKTIIKGGHLGGYLRNAGVPSGFGAPTGANAIIDLYNGATLGFASGSSTDRSINFAGTGPGTMRISCTGNGSGTITACTATGTGAKTLILVDGTFYGSNPGALTVMGTIPDISDGSPLTLQIPFASTHVNNLVTLNGVNTFSGPFTIGGSNTGKVIIGGDGCLGSGSYTNNISIGSGSTLEYASSAAQTLSGVISGAGSLIKSGSGPLTLSGASTFSGILALNVGTLKAGIASVPGVSGAFGTNSTVTLANTAGVILDITGYNTEIGALAGGGASGGNVTLGSSTLTFGAKNVSSNFLGAISGVGGNLIKAGIATNTLSGASTYTGDTTVNGGMLALTATNSIGNTKTLTIAVGAKLDIASGITQKVTELKLGTRLMAKGTWGSQSSGAKYTDNTYFSGSGMVEAMTGLQSGMVITFY